MLHPKIVFEQANQIYSLGQIRKREEEMENFKKKLLKVDNKEVFF